ncbi:nucleic acid-binding protein [Microstroma glucosiphilum]|uniref:Nucleic acid-binding protein n=1 Tax=Pseudomicrostroma glucosiphilum TaxID=1684307 RepID=A0A316U2B4_9BASI|nr:nucleic acid-binding protein [Pseudomicrostroma glucosiphilum]PWN19489.1 nucleic acid-binding protein [Pseudomicrostroma glucosiphilum]
MPGLKRKAPSQSTAAAKPSLSATAAASSTKKPRPAESYAPAPPSALVDSQVDFPRGGGSGLTPFEHASTLREARAEMASARRGDGDLFAEGSTSKKTLNPEEEKKRREDRKKLGRDKQNAKKKKSFTSKEAEDTTTKTRHQKDHIRIEHLNYKRLATGTRLLCSVVAVHPLALIVSLPNQLVGHIPITSISPLFTQKLHEAAEQDSDDEADDGTDDDDSDVGSVGGSQKKAKATVAKLASGLPELSDCYKVGQWVRAAVVSVNSSGPRKAPSSAQEAHEFDKESRRVELTLAPEAVNDGVGADDLAVGFVISAAIKSKEDHGFLLDVGLDGISGFAPFKNVESTSFYPGQVVDAAITSLASQGKSFTASLKASAAASAILGPQDAPSASALVPGCQVTALITASLPTGLNAKLWGMFDATIDSFHLPAPLPAGKEMHEVYKVGSKIKARILWESRKNEMGGLVASTGEEEAGPRAVALSAAPHILSLSAPNAGDKAQQSLSEAYPIGAKVEAKVTHTDSEWGLTCSVSSANIQGFTHISRVSDDHVVKLPSRSGPFALGTTHSARVVGHAPTDRLLLLSFQKSTLEKAFMRVSEVEVGSNVRATVTRIGPNGSAIFLDLGGAFPGVVFPLHFADVPLKKPEKKYKPGATVKARVLSVDPARNRIVLTLKKSLVASELPVISSIQDARVGVVTQATVSKFVENRGLIVDLFGGLRAFVSTSEATEAPLGPSAPTLQSHFYEGKVVTVRLTHVDYEANKLLASVKQASPSYLAKLDVSGVQLGEKVTGTVAAIREDVAVLELQPSKVRGLLSLNILAKRREQTVDALREQLEEGETLDNLIIVDKHAERGFVIVGDARSQQARKTASGIAEPLHVGSLQTGTIAANSGEPNVATVILAGGCRGRLHLTDAADDFDQAALPATDESVQVYLLRLRNAGKRADVIIRPSRLVKDSSDAVKDAEVERASDLKVGEKRRGFVKSMSPAGLFVDLGRNVTARVLIAELFDDFVKEWQGRFKVGQLVSGTITAVDAGHSKVEFSLKTVPGSSKKSKADRTAEKAEAKEAERLKKEAGQLRLQDLEKGMKVNGFVRAVQEYGVFVQIEGSQISGLAHKSQLSDNAAAPGSDPTKAFGVGDRVKAVVLEVFPEKKKVNFGLKPSYFTAEDFEEDDGDESEEDDDQLEGDETQDQDEIDEVMGDDESEEEDEEDDDSEAEGDDSDIEVDAEALLNGDTDDDSDGDLLELGNGEDDEESEASDDSDEDVEMREVSSPAQNKAKATPSALPALELGGGFSWSVPEDDGAAQDSASDSDSDSDDEDDVKAAKRAQNKAAPKAKRGHNRTIEEDLTGSLANKAPESSADFERMLLSSPNSSYLWIQFMSFQLQLSEVEQAREVARRALKVINYREETEKLNVWIALLNLENTYGSDESLERTFKEASQMNDGKTVHLRLASILEQTGKIDKAAEMWKRTAKKFGYSHKVWVGYEHFYLRQKRFDEARSLLPRALQSLEKRKHVKTMAAFALGEFKMGDAERGRTIFEGLVDSYPKRLDLWWQYIDQEASSNAGDNVPGARLLFERALNLKQSTKKVKSILKKWLEFEKRKGDAKGEAEVLARARRFVEELNAAKEGADDEDEEDEEDEE